jgi:hypothetical protein
MKRTLSVFILAGFLINGCSFREPAAPSTATLVPLEELVAEAINATQTAEVTNFSPGFPYSPAQLATLLEPGAELEGRWTPSSVTDITQPIPGYACSGFYGSCWGDWAKNISYGADLKFLLNGQPFGKSAFLYFEDLAEVDAAYQLFYSKMASWEENRDETTNKIWMHKFNPYDLDPIGEQWLHQVGYVLYDPADTPDQAERVKSEIDVLHVMIAFSRCHGFVDIDLYIPAQTDSTSAKENPAERIQEQKDLFHQVYAYARNIDERITPYACNPK